MFSSQQQVSSKITHILAIREYKIKSGLKRVIARNGGTTSFDSKSLNTVQSGAACKIPENGDFIDLVTLVPALTNLIFWVLFELTL